MHVRVVPYNNEWPHLFEQEAALIRAVFADELLVIHHIGSTSVPRLQAKPIIDMMPLVRQIERVDLFNEGMAARNVYIFMGHGPWLFEDKAFTTIFHNAILWAGEKPSLSKSK